MSAVASKLLGCRVQVTIHPCTQDRCGLWGRTGVVTSAWVHPDGHLMLLVSLYENGDRPGLAIEIEATNVLPLGRMEN